MAWATRDERFSKAHRPRISVVVARFRVRGMTAQRGRRGMHTERAQSNAIGSFLLTMYTVFHSVGTICAALQAKLARAGLQNPRYG